MKRLLLSLTLTLSLTSTAVAGPKVSADEMDNRPVQGRNLPGLQLQSQPVMGPTLDMLSVDGEQYSPLILKASKALDMEPEYAQRVRSGLELIYRRNYKGARKHFASLDADFPNTGISAAINALLWQALMIENFDFKYNKQYEVANSRAIEELNAALETGQHVGWTHFLIAGMVGVESIHMVRHSKYVGALGRAFTALEHAQAARKAAPDFIDLSLADGMYNYWRTVITKSSSMLPDFGDHRSLGIKQLQDVEQNGFFLRPAATLALTFSWLQEKDKKRAIAACEKNRKAYPNNVINNLLTGQAYLGMRQSSKALAVLEHLHRVAPENNRAYYYKGLAKQRMGKRADALKDYERYLESDHLEDYQIAMTHYRLGQTYYGLKQYDNAEAHYILGVKANGHKASKANLARLRKARKEGRIQ